MTVSTPTKTEPKVKTQTGAQSKAGKRGNIVSEYWYFLNKHKAWWLLPVLALVLIVGVLVVLGGSQAAMLMYALF